MKPTTRPAPDPDLTFPELGLELVEDISPAIADGFLRLVRRRLRVRYPDGTQSSEFVYDEVDRRAIDAVVIAAHYVEAGLRWIYLRSALRPPVFFRDPRRSPIHEPHKGALWELPAGLVEPGEQTPEGVKEAARRELEEELGFGVATGELIPLGGSTLPCPGVIGERHFFFSVSVDPKRRAEPSLDGSALERFGRVVAVPLEKAVALCEGGQIEDAKTELALRRLRDQLSSRADATHSGPEVIR
jgi:ADP-ribose pyrophosphatase